MEKKIFIFLVSLLFISCRKTNPATEDGYRLENFRKSGMDDYQTLKAAVDSLPENSKIVFDNKTYIFTHTIIVQKSFQFYGPAVIKRENQVNYTLKEEADQFSTKLILNNIEGLVSSDRFILSLGKSNQRNTVTNVVSEINGDTIVLSNPLGKTIDNLDGTYPAGTNFFKNINFFWIVSATRYTDQSCTFNNLTFDGNRDNNSGSYSWLLNAAVLALTKGTTQYKNCKFMNSPGETIVGHNADISNCSFYNLNGSAFHTSADKVNCSESEIHSYLTGNTFENTNQISNLITGHSEGAITHSNSGGYYTATGNTFKNVGESVLGTLYPSVSVHDWGTSNINFTGNTIDGVSRMVYGIALIPGTIHDVKIEKNTILNLTGIDWSAQLSYWPGIILKNKSGE